jgi:hypothetical protein
MVAILSVASESRSHGPGDDHRVLHRSTPGQQDSSGLLVLDAKKISLIPDRQHFDTVRDFSIGLYESS